MITYKEKITVIGYNYLRKSVGWNEIHKEQAEKGLKNSSFITVAYDDEKAVGMARVVSDGGYIAIIVDVIVLPDYQGQGIGKVLIENVMKHLESSVKDSQFLMINLMAATNKEFFYKKFGFVERPNDTMGAGMVKYINK